MTHPIVSRASALVRAGDLAGAERALAALADTEGDHALVAVLDQVPPADLLAIMREYDAAKESVINLLVTPEQFARAAALEPRYGERTHERLIGMMNAVLYRDPAQAVDFLRALGEQPEGLLVLADYFEERWDELHEFAQTGRFGLFSGPVFERPDPEDLPSDPSEHYDPASIPDVFAPDEPPPLIERDEIADHDWKETAWLLRHELPDLFDSLLETIREKQRKAAWALFQTMRGRQTVTGAAGSEEESAL